VKKFCVQLTVARASTALPLEKMFEIAWWESGFIESATGPASSVPSAANSEAVHWEAVEARLSTVRSVVRPEPPVSPWR
jgi:hypothetical protein